MKFININVPKTGGTYIKNNVTQINDNVIKTAGHSRCISDEFIRNYSDGNPYYLSRDWWGVDLTALDEFDKAVKFTVVRNPFDLLVSYFVSRWGDYDQGMAVKVPNGSFHHQIETFCNMDIPWHVPLFRECLYFQLFDEQGNSRCDYALVFDHYDDALTSFCEQHSLKLQKTAKVNTTSGRHDYRRYYNDKLIEMVNNKCKLELGMFNFTFDGYNGDDSILNTRHLKLDWDKLK